MDDNPYRSPLLTTYLENRGVGWWLLALFAGAAIGFTFASVCLWQV